METIKNYLDSMFAKLPINEEVIKAKNSLLEMMEDKYDELIKEGKSENEAVGIVISEFGNLNELADDLGINTYVNEEADTGRIFSLDDAKEYIEDKFKCASKIAIGVFLCIACAVPTIVADWYFDSSAYEDLADGIGAVLLFVAVAAGIAFIIIGSSSLKKWKFMKKEHCSVDFMTVDYVKEQKDIHKSSILATYIIGICLCVLAVTPAILIETVPGLSAKYDDLSGAAVILMVAVGVGLNIVASYRLGAFENILKLNENGILTDNDNDMSVTYKNETVGKIMEVYWPTVTAIFLIVSFLSFKWGITWIIWPVAAIVQKIIRTINS